MALELAPPPLDTGNGANAFGEALELEHLIGMTCDYTNSFVLHPINNNKCIYSIGPTLIVSALDDAHNQVLLKGHDAAISSIAVSHCGTMIASGQKGSGLMKNAAVVNLWDFEGSQLIHTFTGLMYCAHRVLFTPDSRFLIAVDLNGLFIVWDTRTFETIFCRQLVVDRKIVSIDSIRVLSQEPDAANRRHNVYRVLVSYGHSLFEWTVAYSVKRMEYALSSDVKYAYPPNRTFNRTLTHLASTEPADAEPLVAATTHCGEVFLFSPRHGVYSDAFQVCSKGANVACFVASGRIVVGGGDGSLKLFYRSNLTEWVMARALKLPSAVNSLALSADKKVVYATTTEANLYRIDTATFGAALVLESPFDAISAIEFGPKHQHIFATLTAANGVLRAWDLSNYHSVGEVRTNDGGVTKGTALTFYADTEILCGFDDGSVVGNALDFEHPSQSAARWKMGNAHRGNVNAIKIVSDSKQNMLLMTGGDDGLLNIWDYATKRLRSQCHPQIEAIADIVVDAKYPERVHLLGGNGQIATFSLRTEGVIVRRMVSAHRANYGRMNSMVQSATGEFELIAVTNTGWILVWDHELSELTEAVDCRAMTGDERLSIWSCALSKDSRYLCCGNGTGGLFVVNWETKRMVATAEVHSNAVSSTAWTPDGKQIVSSSADSSIAVSNFYS